MNLFKLISFWWKAPSASEKITEMLNIPAQVKALQGQVSAHTKSIMVLLNREEENKLRVRPGKLTTAKPFMVVIPFYPGDFIGAWRLLSWMLELGGCPKRNCLLLADCQVSKSNLEKITSLAKTVFKSVFVESTPHSLPDETWPIGPNWMFQCVLEKVRDKYKSNFFWMEPDCVPLWRGWDGVMQKEYDGCGKPFMGFVVPDDLSGTCPKHLTGWAIYPANAAELILPFVRIDAGASYKNSDGIARAWDVESGSVTVPLTHHSNLFCHVWGEFAQPPTFYPSVPGALSLKSIPSKAVLFHRNKDGSLIDLLRQKNSRLKRKR